MGPKGLLLSFLGVSAITGTVIGGYYVLGPDKSNTTSQKQNNKDKGQETSVNTQVSDPAPAEAKPALAPGSPAKPNNVESTGGLGNQASQPGRPEPGSAGTSNPGPQGSSGASGQAGTAK